MKTLIIITTGLCLVFSAASAQQAPSNAAQAGGREVASSSQTVPAGPAQSADGSAPLSPEELGSLSGRQGSTTILSDQDLTAVNRGNTINANTVGSGQIVLGSGAFDGFAGVGNFVINSGHNNNLQGALTINIVSPQ